MVLDRQSEVYLLSQYEGILHMHIDHAATGQDDQSPKKPQKFYQILYVQVIFAIVAGIL